MAEFKKMRRLSIYFVGDQALNVMLEPGDNLSRTPESFIITGKLGEGSYQREISRQHVVHTYLVTYMQEIVEPVTPDPEAIEPSDDLL